MVHACACCRLRFTSTGELADHIRSEHSEHPPFEEGTVTVVRNRFPTHAFRAPEPPRPKAPATPT